MLEEYRNEIDRIDRGILSLLSDRMVVVEKIGKYKKVVGKGVVDMDRYAKMVAVRENLANEFGLDVEMSKDLFAVVHNYSIKRQKKLEK